MTLLVKSPLTLNPLMAGAGGAAATTSSIFSTGITVSSRVNRFKPRFDTILENLGTSTPLTSIETVLGAFD